MTGLLSPAGRRHIRRLLQALAPAADQLRQRFAALLRKQGLEEEPAAALAALSPTAAAQLPSLSQFLRQARSEARRLAHLNVPPERICDALEQCDGLLDEFLDRRFAPSREQLLLVSRLVVQETFYRVREAEIQAFLGLYQAEAESRGLEELLRRSVAVLVRLFGAASGRLIRAGQPLPGALSELLYIRRGDSGERWIGDPAFRRRYASYWSFPVSGAAVVQLGFRNSRPWLPRERILLAAAAARCREAVERASMTRDLRRLESEARHAEEEERKRIGRDLHDEAGQAMAFLRVQLELLERDSPEHLRPRVAEARDVVARTALELRRLVAALSPAVLDRLGLEAALRQLAARFRRTHSALVQLRSDVPRGLPAPVQEAIYRTVQECLQNIAKHSRATRVNLSVRAADTCIRVRVADNGVGFRSDDAIQKVRSFGVGGMEDRAALLGGTLRVRSAPGRGTTVMLELPLGAAQGIAHGKDTDLVDGRSHPVPAGAAHALGAGGGFRSRRRSSQCR